MTVWQRCQGVQHITPVKGRLFRMVESQVQVATLGYVDTLAEQALLEQMLEQVKPPCPPETVALHYLLKTPFRYPPLPWGSRFGAVYEPALFYGGCSVEATLAESAYYRFVFWQSIDAPPPKSFLRSQHTLFSAGYRTNKGIRLQQLPFSQYSSTLTSKTDYQQTRLLGSAMRASGVEAFEYCSARDSKQRLCVALFSPAAFAAKKPESQSQWLCELSAEQVLFKQQEDSRVYQFKLEQFLVNKQFLLPV